MLNSHTNLSMEEIEIALTKRKLNYLLSLNMDDPIQRQDLFEGLFGLRSPTERIRLYQSVLTDEQRHPGEVSGEIRAPFPVVLTLGDSGEQHE